MNKTYIDPEKKNDLSVLPLELILGLVLYANVCSLNALEQNWLLHFILEKLFVIG